MLGNATLACFFLPLSSTFECAGCECGGCEQPGPISYGVYQLGEGYWTESEVFRPDLKWRSRSADWRAFDGADDLDNDGVYFLDPPLCALDREDGAWRCGHFNAFLDGREELEPVLDEAGAPLRGGVSLRTSLQASCMLDQTGALWCKGKNHYGMLGTGDDTPRSYAVRVELPGQVIAFDVSNYRVCAQLEDTSIYCWGDLLKAGEPRDNWKPQLVDWDEE